MMSAEGLKHFTDAPGGLAVFTDLSPEQAAANIVGATGATGASGAPGVAGASGAPGKGNAMFWTEVMS